MHISYTRLVCNFPCSGGYSCTAWMPSPMSVQYRAAPESLTVWWPELSILSCIFAVFFCILTKYAFMHHDPWHDCIYDSVVVVPRGVFVTHLLAKISKRRKTMSRLMHDPVAQLYRWKLITDHPVPSVKCPCPRSAATRHPPVGARVLAWLVACHVSCHANTPPVQTD